MHPRMHVMHMADISINIIDLVGCGDINKKLN